MMMTNNIEQSSTTADDDLISDRLLVMFEQEESFYYIQPTTTRKNTALHGCNSSKLRIQMVNWCIQVVKHCKLQPQCIEIAMNYVDRYIAKYYNNALDDTKTTISVSQYYQRIVMTCFYIAVKIHAQIAIDPTLIYILSKRTFTVHDIEAMELHVLKILDWRMNPSTAFEFTYEFLKIINIASSNNNKASNIIMNQIYNDSVQIILKTIRTRSYIRSSHLAFSALVTSLNNKLLLCTNNKSSLPQEAAITTIYNILCIHGGYLKTSSATTNKITITEMKSRKQNHTTKEYYEHHNEDGGNNNQYQRPNKRSRIEQLSPRTVIA